MDDITQRLRQRGDTLLKTINPVGAKLCFDAADEIEKLRAVNAAIAESDGDVFAALERALKNKS